MKFLDVDPDLIIYILIMIPCFALLLGYFAMSLCAVIMAGNWLCKKLGIDVQCGCEKDGPE